jgi:Ni,Fe-hydrogenase III component G
MSETETVRTELETKFPFLAGAVRVQRERRLWIKAAQESFPQVFEHLVKGLGFSNLCTITGLDLGAELGFIYHLARDGGIMANIETHCPKGQSIRTVTPLFPGASIYERELEDLLGAKVDGLPPGPRYPLPDDWPTDEHPLLKNWKKKDPSEPDAGSPSAAASSAASAASVASSASAPSSTAPKGETPNE